MNVSEQTKTAKNAHQPEKPQEGHPQTPKNKPYRIPPSNSTDYFTDFSVVSVYPGLVSENQPKQTTDVTGERTCHLPQQLPPGPPK